jgi:hypothetical protein
MLDLLAEHKEVGLIVLGLYLQIFIPGFVGPT